MIISNRAKETSTQEEKVSDSFSIMKGQFWDVLDIPKDIWFLNDMAKENVLYVCICPFVLADSEFVWQQVYY